MGGRPWPPHFPAYENISFRLTVIADLVITHGSCRLRPLSGCKSRKMPSCATLTVCLTGDGGPVILGSLCQFSPNCRIQARQGEGLPAAESKELRVRTRSFPEEARLLSRLKPNTAGSHPQAC
jgi:hypothetical protein